MSNSEVTPSTAAGSGNGAVPYPSGQKAEY